MRILAHLLISGTLLTLAAFGAGSIPEICPGCNLSVASIPGPAVGGSVYVEFSWAPVVEQSGDCERRDLMNSDLIPPWCAERRPCLVEGTLDFQNVSGVDLTYRVEGGPPQPLPAGALATIYLLESVACDSLYEIDFADPAGAPVAYFVASCSKCLQVID